MTQETPQPKESLEETLGTLVEAAIEQARLSPADAEKVRRGIITALEGLGEAGFSAVEPGTEIDMDLPVTDENRRGLQEVVTDTIDSRDSL